MAALALANAPLVRLRALAREAVCSFPRFCTFDPFFRLAMIAPVLVAASASALMQPGRVSATYQTSYQQIAA
jgi:hypothetical protein